MDQTTTPRRAMVLLAATTLLASLALGAVAAPVGAATPRCASKIATIAGTDKSETIRGTAGDDVIVAGGGADTVRGQGGKDLVCGGGGKDQLHGNAGRDKLYGEDGNDRLDGGTGLDICTQGRGSGRRVDCEFPSAAPAPAPAPTPEPTPSPAPTPTLGKLVIGGPGSGQIGKMFWTAFGGAGTWNASDSACYTGQINYGASGIDVYRFAIEFPLSALPPGSTILRAVLSISASTAAPTQNLHGYPGDGNIGVADATVGGPSIGFEAAAPGYQTVDVSSLVTPAMVAAGWAGFLQTRGDPPGVTWACRATDADYPKLTIDYQQP